MSNYAAGCTDAKLDISEGWFSLKTNPMTLEALVAHLKSVNDYPDAYVAGYLSVVYGAAD